MGKFRTFIYLALGFSLIALLFIFLSCGSPKQLSPEAPLVISVHPAPSTEGISIDSQVTIKFDRDMDPASINAASFTLSSPEGSVTGTVTYDASIRTAIFTPQLPLEFFITYTAAISTAAKSYDGGQMSLPYQWHFITAIAMPTTTTGPSTTTTSTTTGTTTTTLPPWVNVGTPGFSAGSIGSISLAIDNGTPYVAFSSTVMKYNGTSWNFVGAPESLLGKAAGLSLYNDIPYVALTETFTYEVDLGRKGTYIASTDEATVMKFNGSTWECVGIPAFSAGNANYITLALDNAVPYVAYQNESNKATVMKFNGSTWESVGTPSFSTNLSSFISIAVYNGTPYVAYQDVANSGKATVMKFNGSSWEIVGSAGFTSGSAYYISLAVDSGIPFVAYSDEANSFKTTVMKFNGSSWEIVGAAGFSPGSADDISLVFYSGVPYIAFRNVGSGAKGLPTKAMVMKFNGSSWENVGTPDFSAGDALYISLAVDNGIPYVAYRDGANSYKATVMKYVGP